MTLYGINNCAFYNRRYDGDETWFATEEEREARLEEMRANAIEHGLASGAAEAGIHRINYEPLCDWAEERLLGGGRIEDVKWDAVDWLGDALTDKGIDAKTTDDQLKTIFDSLLDEAHNDAVDLCNLEGLFERLRSHRDEIRAEESDARRESDSTS